MLSPPLYLPPSALPVEGIKPKSAREILDAIDKALQETRQRLAQVEGDIEGPAEPQMGVDPSA